LTTLSCSASGIFAICCDLTRPTITRLARTFQSTRTRRRREQYMPLAEFCLRHFLADFIICMCEFDFRQAHRGAPLTSPSSGPVRACKIRPLRGWPIAGPAWALQNWAVVPPRMRRSSPRGLLRLSGEVLRPHLSSSRTARSPQRRDGGWRGCASAVAFGRKLRWHAKT
jgi:hypothetical protein